MVSWPQKLPAQQGGMWNGRSWVPEMIRKERSSCSLDFSFTNSPILSSSHDTCHPMILAQDHEFSSKAIRLSIVLIWRGIWYWSQKKVGVNSSWLPSSGKSHAVNHTQEASVGRTWTLLHWWETALDMFRISQETDGTLPPSTVGVIPPEIPSMLCCFSSLLLNFLVSF